MTIRSFLFVPADNEKKLARGGGSGADALIIDLEDSVAPERKALARDMACGYLNAKRGSGSPRLWVRINPIAEGGIDDIVAIVRAAPDGLVVPKIDHPADLARLSSMLDALERRDAITVPIQLMPVATETPRAPLNLAAYTEIPLPRLFGLTWGAEDLSTALGASTNKGPDGQWAFTYRMVRSSCLLAAKAAGVEAIDTLYADFRDAEGLLSDCAEASREGFTGRIAIHPDQVGPINAAFSPSEQDVARAQRVIAAFSAVPGTAVVGLDGRMLDLPHLRQAEQVLARVEALSRRTSS